MMGIFVPFDDKKRRLPVGWVIQELRGITPIDMTPDGYRNWARRILESAYAVDGVGLK